MSAERGFAALVILIGSLAIIFTLGVLNFTGNLSQEEKNLQSSENAQIDEYPGWKVFTSPQHEFTIRFPKHWYIKEYGTYAADFVAVDPAKQESSQAAALVRFLSSSEIADTGEFEQKHKLKDNQKILEHLDVKSQLTKNKNLNIGGYEAIDYQIERNFSAPVGPRKEYSQIYEINKDGVILKFSAHSKSADELIRFNDSTLSQMISSLKFKK